MLFDYIKIEHSRAFEWNASDEQITYLTEFGLNPKVNEDKIVSIGNKTGGILKMELGQMFVIFSDGTFKISDKNYFEDNWKKQSPRFSKILEAEKKMTKIGKSMKFWFDLPVDKQDVLVKKYSLKEFDLTDGNILKIYENETGDK